MTAASVVDQMARELPNHQALVTEDRSFTFAQLRTEVRRTAAAVIALGVDATDRVAIWSPNTWEWVVACLAAQYAGAVVVPVNTAFTAVETADVLARTGAPLLIATDEFLGVDRVADLDQTALPALRHVVRIPAGARWATGSSWEDFLAGPRASESGVDARAGAVRPHDIAEILFTSGTTGRSKGVLSTHRQSLSMSAAAAGCRGIKQGDRFLCIPPLFHTSGYRSGLLGCLQTGATLVLHRNFDPEHAIRVIAEQRISVLLGPPTLFQLLLDHPARKDWDLNSLRSAITGTTRVPPSLIERMRTELGFDDVLTCYGLTESTGFATTCRPGDDAVTVATTCGRPIAGVEVRIDRPDDCGVGEILLRGPNVMRGYLDDPAATAAAIDADGWLHTGDVGDMDAAGNLRIADRLGDMFISCGFNVYPAEVERVLAGLDGVIDAAVIGVPDEQRGEVGRAFVVKRADSTLDETAVIAFLRRQLAHFKTPRSVVFLPELPRNAGGKIRKAALREIRWPAGERVGGPTRVAAPRGHGGPPRGMVENWIADVWQILLRIEKPGRLDRFIDLDGDSIAAVEFCRMVHDQFGVSISVDRFAAHQTIAALVGDLRPGTGVHRESVVRLRTDDDGPIYLLVPGLGGHAWNFFALADALIGPCDVLALSPLDLSGGPVSRLRTGIRSAALASVSDAVAAGRPIVLAGYSFGALIATDLACWLIENSLPVEHLCLLDPQPLDSRRPHRSLRSIIVSALRSWTPSVYRAARKWRYRELAAACSPAAWQLEEDIAVASRELKSVYLDGSIRLPSTGVSWIQSAEMAAKNSRAATIYGTPVAQLDRETVGLDHQGVMRVSTAGYIATWLDQRVG